MLAVGCWVGGRGEEGGVECIMEVVEVGSRTPPYSTINYLLEAAGI